MSSSSRPSDTIDDEYCDALEEHVGVCGKKTGLHLAHSHLWAQFKQVCGDR